ncbi:MAG: beta-ketoacyl-ACP synthase II [Solirubrobacteraceae bacterium]|nr:beta-ketoacyl-ACP synthase II [Solirubrobacteraceae bacterium]
MQDVVITGVGAVTPLGVGAETLHREWVAGTSGIRGGEGACADFDVTEVMTAKQARRADRFTQLAVGAAEEAIAQANLEGIDGTRMGCIVGTGIGGIGTIESSHTTLGEQGPGRVPPLSVPLMMSNAAPAAIAMRHDLRGPVFGVVSACAAGSHAIGAAARTIRCGDADVVVTGGAEAALTPLTRAAFAALEATSPTGESRPFDARRNGFVMGEGAGALVLEDRAHAEARGATILGVLAGYGATSDAFHLTSPREDGAGAAQAIGAALLDAGISPEGVDYVNAHGTSTPLNDAAETNAIKSALGDHATKIPVSSLKSSIGHLLGAAGAVEAVATVLALRERVAPPTLNWEERDEGLDLDYVPGAARPLTVDGDRAAVGISNSFGFGGHNAVLVLTS